VLDEPHVAPVSSFSGVLTAQSVIERGESFHHDPHEIDIEFSADQIKKIAVAALGLATAIFENLNSIL